MSLQKILSSKPWVGFDLDDTLHEFRRASTHASTHVFETIHAFNSKISTDALRATYQTILCDATANAFTDGRTSNEYRRERFGRLLDAYGLTGSNSPSELENPLLDRLIEIYHNHLRESLALKPGVLQLLQALQQIGKKIIVITEGPADGQEWTAQELGIRPYIDFLVTANEVGRSKIDGLFGVVLATYDIKAGQIVYFGDNEVRDVQAAQGEGILAVLYDEKQESRLDDETALRVNSWAAVENALIYRE